MITLKRRIINVPVTTVMEDLLNELNIRGINYLRELKPNGNNLQTCCPYHNNGLEKNPSGGITIEATPQNDAGTFHCFTCGTVASLPQLVGHCLGGDERLGERWLLERYNSQQNSDRMGIITKTFSIINSVTNNTQYVSEEELDSYRYYHPYMYQRKLTDEVIQKFDVGYDSKSNCITFPCNDINGNCLFITRRSVVSKYFNMPSNVDKPVYGLDKVEPNTHTLVIVESIINALTLWTWGIPAVALLGTGTKSQYKTLEAYPARKYILAFDGDDAGRKAAIRFKKSVKGKLIENVIMPDGKDINDITYQDYQKLKKERI